MLKFASAFALALALGTSFAHAQENGSSGNGANWFEQCSPATVNEIAAVANQLSDANPLKVRISKQARSCMLRLSAAMKKIQ